MEEVMKSGLMRTSQQTGNLRWNGDVLEQEFFVEEWRVAEAGSRKAYDEWRPVPKKGEGDA